MIRCMRNYVDKGVVKSTKAKEGYSQQISHTMYLRQPQCKESQL